MMVNMGLRRLNERVLQWQLARAISLLALQASLVL
jgi:hypothetical protein